MSSTTSWFDLPFDLKSNILGRIGVRNRLEKAQKVCSDWFKVCKDPFMWRVIDMSLGSYSDAEIPRIRRLSKLAVDRSQGQLVGVSIPSFGTNEALLYVAHRSSQLRRLTIFCKSGVNTITMFCKSGDNTMRSLPEALKKFPLLEELKVYSLEFPKEAIEVAGRYCPLLKKLIIENQNERAWDNHNATVNDEIAIAIGENLHELRHLELFGNGIGLEVILDGCPHLVDGSLILRMCWCIDLKGDVVKRCSQQIKCLELPYDFSNDDGTDDDFMVYDEDYRPIDYDGFIDYEYDDTLDYVEEDFSGDAYNSDHSDTGFDFVDYYTL